MWLYFIVILLMPMETHPIMSRVYLGFSVVKWVGFSALLVAFAGNLQMNRKPLLLGSMQGRLFILLFIWVVVHSLSFSGFVLLSPIQVYISFFVFFLLTLSVVNSAERVRLLVWGIVIAMFISSLYGIKEYLFFTRMYGGGRASGTFKDFNYFALSLVIAMPFVYYLLKTVRSELVRMSFYCVMIIYSMALTVTFSRGAFVGIAAMILTTLVISKRKGKTLLVLVILVLVSIHFIPDELFERFNDIKVVEKGEYISGKLASSTNRYYLLKSGMKMIIAHPFVGIGQGNFKRMSKVYEPDLPMPYIAHNNYLQIGAELGLPALFFFMGIIFYTYRSLFRLRRQLVDDPKFALLPTVMIVSLTGFMVTSLFLSAENTKFFWLLIFLTIALERVVREQTQLEAREAIDVEANGLEGVSELAGSAKNSAIAGATVAETKALSTGVQGGWSGGQE